MTLTIIVSSLVALIMGVFSLIYILRNRQHQKLKQLSIPGPTPHWLFGNLMDLKKKPLYDVFQDWTKEFGSVWGYYEGPTANVVTSDLDILHEVFVKQFSGFHGRKMFPMQPDPDTSQNVNMFFARGERWKRLRTTINPAFTEKQMRAMFKLVDGCLATMLSNLEKEVAVEGSIEKDIYSDFQALTLDVICETAFGVEIRSQENPDHPFIKKLRQFFSFITRFGYISMFVMMLPEVAYVLRLLVRLKMRLNRHPTVGLREGVRDIIKARREAGQGARVDLLQLMLDAEVQTSSEGLECPAMTNASSKKKKTLSTEEIASQSLLFLFAGYETSSVALGYSAYALATHPEVQQKLSDEIKSAYAEMPEEGYPIGDPRFYAAISDLPYLDAFIREVLRFRPFTAMSINRQCMRSGGVQIKGFHLPEGINVIPDIHTIHFDADVWGPIDPQIFEPERFLCDTPRHPMAFLTFGGGPRICIGMRLAMMEMKTCLARLLHRYVITRSANTPDVLPVKLGATIAPKDGVVIKLELRQHSAV